MTISLAAGGAGEGIIGFSSSARRTTTRLLDAQFPAYRSLLPTEFNVIADVDIAPLVDAVKRVALVADRGAPVRLDFTEATLALSAGGEDEGRAEEQLEVTFDGEEITTAFNPGFLLDGLSALAVETARLQFISAAKPAVLRAAEADANASYTYLIMPVRLPG